MERSVSVERLPGDWCQSEFDIAVAAVVSAGGTVASRGEFAPGLPYAFIKDPDGYEIEIWFESDTADV